MKVFADRFEDKLWIGNFDGLHTFSLEDSVQVFKDINQQKVPFLIYSMAQTDDGSLFLGSHGKGIWMIRGGKLTPLDSCWA